MKSKITIGIILIIGTIMNLSCQQSKKVVKDMHDNHMPKITQETDIPAIFPTTSSDLEERVDVALQQARLVIDQICAIPDNQRTYVNTLQAFDRLCAYSPFSLSMATTQIIDMVSPDKVLRETAQAVSQEMEEFLVDNISNNVTLYKALKAYADGNAVREHLSVEQRYYLKELIEDFERDGLNLPKDQLAKVGTLKKEIALLSQNFERAIALDASTITVTREELAGLDEDYIKSLKGSDKGLYVLGVDYPTYSAVMENCAHEQTRKRLFIASNNRAYPANDAVLKEVITKRDELATLLGYPSYAHLNLANSMVQSPEAAHVFLDELIQRLQLKVEQEFTRLTKELPAGVNLTEQGTIKPWDWAFIKSSYKKKYLAVDERAIAEYFPMESTIQALLDIYYQFLGITFKEVQVKGLWHPDVRVIKVIDPSDNHCLGYLLLDLYPRADKYSHACHAGIIPAIFDSTGGKPAKISVVIANFPQAIEGRPPLLQRNDVNTFFHEFGHAIHSILGRTTVASLSGTSVKRDFVEMPSQMLEEWLWDAEMLKKISQHYVTGKHLTDEMIKNIIQLKHFDSGDWAVRQACLSKVSLYCFAAGANKDPYQLLQHLQITIRKHIAHAAEDHMYASFGHLMGYGAQYYGYLWSKVYALDLFNEIKQQGLLNPVIGKKYIAEVIGKGGSENPTVLLTNFLGREPRQDAFFESLGI